MTKPKATHENWGGPRKARPGKKMGRPRLYNGAPMAHRDFRFPAEWLPKITAAGDGDFAEGLRRIIQNSGIV